MSCFCGNDEQNYEITIVQGDKGSYKYIITNSDGSTITNIKSVFFTCSALNIKKTLTKIKENTFSLEIDSDITTTLKECTCSYDITLVFNDDTIFTIIRSAVFTVLKKENPLYG